MNNLSNMKLIKLFAILIISVTSNPLPKGNDINKPTTTTKSTPISHKTNNTGNKESQIVQIFEKESDGNVTNYGNFTPVKRQNVRQDVPLPDNLLHKFQITQNTVQDQINQLKQDSQPAPVSAQTSNNGWSNSASNSNSGLTSNYTQLREKNQRALGTAIVQTAKTLIEDPFNKSNNSENIAAAAALNSGGFVNPANTIVNQNSNTASSAQEGSNSVNASAIGLNNNAGGNGNQDGGETQVVELPGSGTVQIVGPNGNATVIKTDTSISVSANNIFN